MATPFEPIPESTQVHVDRLLGARVGEWRIEKKLSEGRFGTIYLARHATSAKPATLEALRAGRVGNDDEVSAANALKCSGIANVIGSGELPDGRRYRLMEHLDGEPLDERLHRGQPTAAREVARLLAKVAAVLETAHAWHIVHGNLVPSSVFVVGDGVKLIDFGLAQARVEAGRDLRALGALGVSLLSAQEHDGATTPPLPGTPEPLARVLRELLEGRLRDATLARRELELLEGVLVPDRTAARPPGRGPRLGLAVALAVALLAIGAAVLRLSAAPAPAEPSVVAEEDDALALEEEEEPGPPEVTPPLETADAAAPLEPRPPVAPTSVTTRRPKSAPSAEALLTEISRLEVRIRGSRRSADDLDQALFVLNKQRLRLAGTPTEQDRRDVARQLAGWKRSYLRR
ncbi:MAG: protein kinase domain-containing protein [Myxococcota bacterium]